MAVKIFIKIIAAKFHSIRICLCTSDICKTVLIHWSLLQGYSYVAPSVLFSENVVSDDIFQPNADKRPNSALLLSCTFRVSGIMSSLIFKKLFTLNVPYIKSDDEKSISKLVDYSIHTCSSVSTIFPDFVSLVLSCCPPRKLLKKCLYCRGIEL